MKLTVTWALVGVLALGILGCQPSDDTAKEEDSLPSTPNSSDISEQGSASNADRALLSGQVPPCPELASASRLPYRHAAFRVCEEATTADARMKNVGCYARQRISQCVQSEETRNFTLEQYNAEKKAALQ